MATDQPGESPARRGTPDDWLLPRAPGPVCALVRLPGSKSMTNRALVLAALADRPTLISGPLVARDTQLMADALRALGCRIDELPGAWRVGPASLGEPFPGAAGQPRSGELSSGRPAVSVDVGNAGTVLRFVPPAAALTGADVTFRGDARVSQRPVGPLLDALRALGAAITDDGTGAVPFIVHGRGSVPGGTVTIDASSSSQLVSGLLLAAPRFSAGAQIRHYGATLPSAPHIEMTVLMLRACGADVRAADDGAAGAGSGPASLAGTGETGPVEKIWRVLPG